MLLFDTSASIEWLKGNKKMSNIEDIISLSTITVYELLWSAQKRGKRTLNAVNLLLDGCKIIPVTEKIARLAADIKAQLSLMGKDKTMADLLIAATSGLEEIKLISFDSDYFHIAEQMDIEIDIMKFF